MMEVRKIKVGFIGTGNFVAGNHLPNVKANPAMHIRVLCDLNSDLLQQRYNQFGADYVTTDAEQVFTDSEVELVIIGTRHEQHAPLSIRAAKAGKDVFCEKPMAHTFEQMREVVQVMKTTGRRYMVGHNRRFAPAMLAAKQIIASRPRPLMLLYRIVDNAELWPKWPMLPENGGKILNECCHIFDLLAWLIDAEPARIYCVGGLDDNNIVTLNYNDGTIATIVSGGLGSDQYPKELLEVFCGGATVAVDNFLQLKVDGIANTADKFFPYLHDRWGEGIEEKGSEGYRKRMHIWREHIVHEDFVKKYYYNLPQVDKGHYNELDHFAHCIRENLPLGVSAVDAARATICSLKAIESIKSGKPVEIKPSDYFMELKP
jgi:predicted dehydrogenase